jgi:hypothetical protein
LQSIGENIFIKSGGIYKMAKARVASATQSKIGMLLYGEQFTGKSTMAMQFCYMKRPDGKPFRVLYLDPETGSIDDYLGDLENNGIDLRNLYIVYTQSLAEVEQYINKVKNHEDIYELDDDGNETDTVLVDADGEPFRADAIVVDGSTILNLTAKQGLVEFSKKRNKVKADKEGLVGDARLVKIEGSQMELKDYSMINYKGQNLILDLAASGVHYIVTARETDEKVSVKGADGQITSVATGKKIPDGFKQMGYNAKTVIRMFRNEDGDVCAHVEKDRTHVHEDNSILEDPTLLDWQAVIDKTAKNKVFVVKNDLNKSVEVEQNLYAKEVLGSVGDPAKEESSDSISSAANLDNLRAEIKNKISSLSPTEKADMKKKLTDAVLPTAFKNVTDAEVLKKVLEIL